MFEKVLIIRQKTKESEAVIAKLSGSYFVVWVKDMHAALAYINHNTDIKAIVLDIDNPEISAEQFLSIISVHSSYRRMRVILVANSEDDVRIAELLKAGAVDFVTKPMDSTSLKIVLDRHLVNNNFGDNKIDNDTNMILETLFKDAPIGVAITRVTRLEDGENLQTVVMNKTYERLVGRTSDDIKNHDWQSITHPDDIAESVELFRRLEKGEISSYSRHKRYLKPDGTIVWVNLVVSTFDQKREGVFSYVSLVQDITEQKTTSNLLNESERSKSILLSHLPGLAYRCKYDDDWTMLFVSQGCEKLTGYLAEDLLFNNRLSFNELIAPEYRQSLWQEWRRVISQHLPFTYEYQIETKEGNRKWVLEMGEGVYNEQDEVVALEGIIIDIDHLKKMEEKIQHEADYDTRYDLHNRGYFERLIEEDIKLSKINTKALVCINFSTIQALVLSNGYHYAMDLVSKLAKALKVFEDNEHQLFVTHENRFCFYVDNYENRGELVQFFEKIKEAVEPILLLERFTCGVGILEVKDVRYSNADRLLKDGLISTERALQIENQKVINFVFYDKVMQLNIEREKTLKEELIELSKDEEARNLIVHFQPVIDLKTDRVVSFEALARFNSPTLGVISPLEFIPMLEKTKLIIPVGEQILTRSLKFLERLNKSGFDVSMSINVSAIQLLSENFAINVLQKIIDIDVNPTKIWLEITESIFANSYKRFNQILGNIMQTGVRVTIDDFGTGYSSLHRVLELNTNGIKVDRAFINGLELISEDVAITKDIVSLGHKLNYLVVAEGIENETQLKYLKAYNCDRGQGYLFSRPLPEEIALDYIKKINI